MIKTTKQPGGYTLIELLVYVAVLMVFSIAVVTAFLSFNKALALLRVERMVTDNATRVMDRFERDARNADGVDIFFSSFGTSPSTVVLDNVFSDDVAYTLTGDQITVAEGTKLAIPLTGSEVTVSDFTAYYYTGTTTEMLRIEFSVSATSGKAVASDTFYTGVVIRGSYD